MELSSVDSVDPHGEAWTFETAAAFWKTWESRCDDRVWARFDVAEQYLLQARPVTAAQAAILVEVLISNADSPLDEQPLRNLQEFLSGIARDASDARESCGRRA